MTREIGAKPALSHSSRSKSSPWIWFDAELADLAGLARALRADFPQAATFMRNWDRQCAALAECSSDSTIWAETALDDLATRLRKICLRIANLHSIRVYRSPPDHQMPQTSEEHPLDFGYERDIRPAELEARIAMDAISAPGWSAKHLLFSSGQSALQAILLAARRLIAPGQSCKLRHLGSYFETDELAKLLEGAGLFHLSAEKGGARSQSEPADVIVYEPVHCTPEAQARGHDGRALLERICAMGPPKAVIFDTTLCHQRFDHQEMLDHLYGLNPVPLAVIFRSGLKLDQAGLELANVGIVSLLGAAEQGGDLAGKFASELRRIRTLTGSGLRFEDINALSVPWFLGPDGHRYADRIFANNARLAEAFNARESLTLLHPRQRDQKQVAPFCLLQLPEGSGEEYRRFEDMIDAEARRRGILLQRGGSFGFRGHRYQAIVPEHGQAFIRLALGARRDASSDRIIEMLNDFPWAS